jgi:GNAT superfamily N-acetyltransferase
MNTLRRFYDICTEAGVPMSEPFEVWEPAMQHAILEQKADLWPIGAHGEMIGGAMFMADTVHLAILPAWQGRWMTKALRRAYDTWTHTVPIRAIVRPDNHKIIEFDNRLGFTFRSDDGLYHTYIKEPTHA